MSLADLPDELIISVLLHLRAEDLYRCMRLSKRIAGIIQGTARLRYHALLDLYGLEDNEECRADVNEKIESLLLREDAYLNFRYRFEESTTSDGYPSIYDLSSGRFVMGNENGSMSVRSAKLPTEAGQRITWSEIIVGQFICDFGTAVEEHDLIAFVVSSPTPNGLWRDIDVALYKLSGQPHPEAQHPQIHLLRVDETWGLPSVSIEIVGDTLAVITYYAFDFENAGSRLLLFSWRTGVALNPGGQPATNLGLCFLTPDLLMHPSEETRALEVFRVPTEPSGPDLELVCELVYPDFHPDAEIYNTVCRGDPNPSLSHVHRSGAAAHPFRTRVEDSVVLVLMTWRLDRGEDEE
ncbi:uncharacterized protein SCHCODRAFT_02478678, partial [Schizophyllum commune H4-8]|uniref:uncharacterized protein n=1 Tax=Schizophyllum commune (strain H4-8 / FGSC 9210) TaxID=578458 RepID=UPI00216041E9